MKTIKINQDDIQTPGFLLPPANGGQMVEVSYARTEDYILVRTYDRSDRSERIVAHRWPASGEFAPQQSAPKLGRKAGIVEVCREEGSIETESAVKRSISHNEIVRVVCADPAALTDWIADNYDDVDHARENDGDLDVWGKRSGEDFRLRVGKADRA